MTHPTRNATSLLLFLAKDTSGSVPIEYGLIGSAICVVLAGIVFAMGDQLVNMWTSVLNMFN